MANPHRLLRWVARLACAAAAALLAPSASSPAALPAASSPAKIAYMCNSANGTYSVCTMTSDGRNRRDIGSGLRGVAWGPSWSPDHTRIAYTGWGSPRPLREERIWTMRADGTDAHPVNARVGWQLAWSPRGDRIAFSRGRSIWVVDIASGVEHRVRTPPGEATSPAWSPDGRWLVFVYARAASESTSLYLVRPNGADAHPLGLDGEIEGPTWSRRGNRIAFVESADIYVFDVGRRTLTRIVQHLRWGAENPAWSPDGRRIVFDHGGDLFLVDVATRKLRRLAGDVSDSPQPAWCC